MAQRDFDRLMHEYYRDQANEHAPDRLAERIESIPDNETELSITPRGWRQRLGRWLGRDDGDMRNADSRGTSRPTKDGRNRLMITVGAATAVLALALGATLVMPQGPVDQAPAMADQTPSPGAGLPDDAMRAGPVTVTSCDTQVVSEGTSLEGIDHTVGWTELSTWESSGSLYGEDEPRLAGEVTRVRNWSYGTFDDLRDAELEQNAFRVVNDGGAWEGTSTMFVRSREPGRSTELLVLEGQDGYDGLTAVLQFPLIDDEAGVYPDCYEVYGIVIESGILPMPVPIDAGEAELEPVAYPIGTAITDDGFLPPDETGFALAPGTWTIEIMNTSERERGFAIEDPSGQLVAGSADVLIAPGEMRSYALEVAGSGEGYVMYDPTDREGTETAIPAAD